MIKDLLFGLEDLHRGVLSWRIWYLLGSAALRQRYSRTRFGQIWLIFSSSIFLIFYGVLFSFVFGAPIEEILPYIAVSFTLWRYMSGIVVGATNSFVVTAGLYKNEPLPYSISILSRLYESTIVLLYESIIVVLILLYYNMLFEIYIVNFTIVLSLFLFTAIWVGYSLAIICTRYRDMSQFIASIMQAAFLLTPVIWELDMLPEHVRHWAYINPFTPTIVLLRGPILGEAMDWTLFAGATIFSIVAFAATMVLVGRMRHSIVFWI